MWSMTRTKAMAVALATTTLLLLGACGSDEPEAAGSPSTTAPTSSAPAPTAEPTTAEPTTPKPTRTTSEPTNAAPAGQLISYANGEDDGVLIATAADVGKLKGAPADFTRFIAAELSSATPEDGCTEKPQISVDAIDTGGWARGGHFTPECGGYATLWARAGGTWKDVWGGQSIVECSLLTQYKFPARIAGDTCLKGDEAVSYPG